MICYAIKDSNNLYWCGMNYWDKQLRKARFYNSYKYALAVLEDSRFQDRELRIVFVELHEVNE